jgi:hypothetical protein
LTLRENRSGVRRFRWEIFWRRIDAGLTARGRIDRGVTAGPARKRYCGFKTQGKGSLWLCIFGTARLGDIGLVIFIFYWQVLPSVSFDFESV